MSILRITVISFLSLTLVAYFLVQESFGAEREDMAVSTIGSAEEAVVSTYGVVLKAEDAGADVSGLLERLNAATKYLAWAKMCSRREDFDGATRNARLCIEIAEGVAEDAKFLRYRAVRERGERSWMMIGGSVVGIVVAIFVSFLSWGAFKKRYCERVLKMKPEVSEAES